MTNNSVSVQTLKIELAEELNKYSKYLNAQPKGFVPVYSIATLIELKEIVTQATRIKPLHDSISAYLEKHCSPPFGEWVRGLFNTEKDHDLSVNVKKVLLKPKYSPAALKEIEKEIDMEERISQRLRQEFNSQASGNKEEADRLRRLNKELQDKLKELEDSLQKMKQERDYWYDQFNTMKKQCNNLMAEKANYKSAYESVKQENEILKKQSSLKVKPSENAIPETVTKPRQI